MSSRESWELTPREFAARHNVYQSHFDSDYKRWITDRVDRVNGPLRKRDGSKWTLQDFGIAEFVQDLPLNGAERARVLARRAAGLPDTPNNPAQAERDAIALAREKARDARYDKLMRSGNFDESLVPKWARMTKAEKAARGNQ
jgi:hypothetical protein